MDYKDRSHWDEFVYGLLYPGFVGSMIYELIPQTSTDADPKRYISIFTGIKWLITFLYCLDFLHLFSDMKSLTPKSKRPVVLIWGDILTSLILFGAFVFVKMRILTYPIVLISVIPWVIRWHKKHNVSDRVFFNRFGAMSSTLSLLFFASEYAGLKYIDLGNYLFGLSFLSLVLYCYYVFVYYNRHSKAIDIKLYK